MEKGNANKHLTYEQRQYIEIGLNQGRSFSKIAQDIKKIDEQYLERYKNTDLRKFQGNLIIRQINVNIKMNAKSLTVQVRRSVMKKIFVK